MTHFRTKILWRVYDFVLQIIKFSLFQGRFRLSLLWRHFGFVKLVREAPGSFLSWRSCALSAVHQQQEYL
jgi:hypothetical protein